MSQDILNILNRKSVDLNNVLTGDEVWIYWQNFHQTKWMAQGEKMQTIPKQTFGSKKSMFSIFFFHREDLSLLRFYHKITSLIRTL